MSPTSIREAKESPIEIGTSEKRAIVFDFTLWSLGTLTDPVVTVFDVTSGARTDVTATVLPGGTDLVSGDTVISKIFRGDLATVGHTYRAECKVSHGSGEESELFTRVEVRY